MVEISNYNDTYKVQTISLLLSVLEDELGYVGYERPDIHDIPDVYQKDDLGNFWLAIDGDQVVGTIALQNYGKNRAMIKRMSVKKEYRRKGIGQRLLTELITFAKKSNLETVYLTTMNEFEAARNLYEKNGFQVIDELPEDMAMPDEDIYMKLKVS